MTNNSKRDLQMLKADISFAVAALFGIAGVTVDSFDFNREAILPVNSWLTTGVIVGLGLLVGFAVTKIAAIDRLKSEEYTFQLMSSSALVSVLTTLFVTFVWSSELFLATYLGKPTTGQIIALLLGSWSVGYFTYRVRGVGE